MSTLPAGTVTFLFTDIEGSTRLWQQHPETMKVVLARHHDLLQRTIESCGGYVFQIIGDAFCAAFHTALEGVDAAVAAQGALTCEQWGETGPIRVRMALHTGAAEVQAGEHKSGEYVSGLTLSHTARLLSVAYGGQILVSNATRQLLSDELLPRVKLRDLGRHQLRDLPRAEHIFRVVAPNLPEVFPALKSLDAVPSNLPRQLTSFIGRETEIGEIKRLLAGARLLTLTGSGGSGKTRLSLEIGAALFDDCPDGVWLLELAPVADPVLVPQVLATTLGVREEAARPLSLTLVDYLRPKRALLLFDNCEHLIDACAQLAETLLRACADVKILASSREPLGLTGEMVFHVPPLALPDPRQLPPLGRLGEYEAIRLFVDRAVAVKPAFALTETNGGAVAQICRQLDGIPLAIELAAARVRALSVQQITANLDERFRLLIGSNRTTLPRHQTLRGLIDWSYGLLSDAESTLFRRLSVFVGGWTFGAAEAVCVGDGVDRHDVVTLLGRLVDKSLVVMDDQTGEARYRLLETIRQYGLEKLRETPEGEVVRDRHRTFYLALAEDAEHQLLGPDQVAWLERLEADHDNLRAALRWSLDQSDTEPALRLGGALWPFWDTHWYIGEGRKWLEELLAKAGEPASAVTATSRRALAKVLDGVARMRARWSEFAEEMEIQIQALALWRELGDTLGTAETLNNLGVTMRDLGDRPRARPLVEESLALFRGLSDKRGIAHALNNLGEILDAEGDHAGATRLFEESVPLFETIQDTRGLAHALDNLGGILTAQGDYARADPLYGKSLQLAERLGDKHAIAVALRSLGGVAHHRGDHARARSFYEESVGRFREMNDRFCLAKALVGFALTAHDAGDHEHAHALGDEGLALLRDTKGELAPRLNQLGRAAFSHGDLARAARFCRDSLALYAETNDAPGIAASLMVLARVAAAHGQRATLVRLVAAADALCRARDIARPDADRDACDRALAAVRAEVDAGTFDTAWTEGASMTLAQVIECAGVEKLEK